MVLHWRLHKNQGSCFKVSHLFYAIEKYTQYQIVVKLPGSFRLTALNRHLHRYCIFTEQISETVPHSLHHSCASELTWQGISLFYSPKKDSLFIRFVSCDINLGCMALVHFNHVGLTMHYCTVGSYLMCNLNSSVQSFTSKTFSITVLVRSVFIFR